MDRAIVYAGSIPLDTDLLRAGRYAKAGLGNLAALTFGSQANVATGLQCIASADDLSVSITPGSVLAPGVMDETSIGATGAGLQADTTSVMCQYVSAVAQRVAIPYAGATFTLYAVCQEQDTDASVLAFFNASNPNQTLAGSANNGQTLPTRRTGAISVVAATQLPATPPGGAVLPLYNIVVPSGAPTAAGVTITPVSGTFPTPVPQLAPLHSPALSGVPTTPTPDGSNLEQVLNLASLAQFAGGRLSNIVGYWKAGSFSYTPSSGVQSAIVIVHGGGASGYGVPATATGQVAIGSGGGSGAFAVAWISGLSASGSVPITVGAGGVGQQAAGVPGGNSAFGNWVNAPGGQPGTVSGVVQPIWCQGSKTSAVPTITGGAIPLVARAGLCGGESFALSMSSGLGGDGASSVFGAGGPQMQSGVSGASGGQGAGGAGTFNAEGNPVPLAGGSGGDGVVLVIELA